MVDACRLCRGACCTYFRLPLDVVSPIDRDWLAAHGTVVDGGTVVEIDQRCTKLTDGGKCSIYERRPLTCVLFMPGSGGCLSAIARQRSVEEAMAIVNALGANHG